jgi:hypothetical protein
MSFPSPVAGQHTDARPDASNLINTVAFRLMADATGAWFGAHPSVVLDVHERGGYYTGVDPAMIMGNILLRSFASPPRAVKSRLMLS